MVQASTLSTAASSSWATVERILVVLGARSVDQAIEAPAHANLTAGLRTLGATFGVAARAIDAARAHEFDDLSAARVAELSGVLAGAVANLSSAFATAAPWDRFDTPPSVCGTYTRNVTKPRSVCVAVPTLAANGSVAGSRQQCSVMVTTLADPVYECHACVRACANACPVWPPTFA